MIQKREQISPRKLIEKAQNEVTYNTLPDNLKVCVRSITYSNIYDLGEGIKQYIAQKPTPLCFSPINYEHIFLSTIRFHKNAGTLTPAVAENINRLRSAKNIIRIAHQPNLFPSLSIINQFLFLDAVSKQLQTQSIVLPQVYVMIDYDNANDARFRVAHMPDANGREGSLPLLHAVPKTMYDNPIWSIPKPSRDTITHWIQQIKSITIRDLKLLSKKGVHEKNKNFIFNNINDLDDIIWDSYERSSGLAEFNAIFLSIMLNKKLGLPIAFVHGSDIQNITRNAYNLLLSHWSQMEKIIPEAVNFFLRQGIDVKFPWVQGTLPFWLNCTRIINNKMICNSRVSLISNINNEDLNANGTCPRCGIQYKFNLGTLIAPDISSLNGFIISPRVLFDNLLDPVALGVVGGSGYIGQSAHMLITNYVSNKIGFEMPPHTLFASSGVFYSTAECEAIASMHNSLPTSRANQAMDKIHCGKISVLYYIINQGFDGFKEMWTSYFASGNKVSNINDGMKYSSLFVPDEISAKLRYRLNSKVTTL